MTVPCPLCACVSVDGGPAHSLLAMLAADDVDAALDHGLLDTAPCSHCAPSCTSRLLAAREARMTAFAARERHRNRAARVALRKATRDSARLPVAPAQTQSPALPSAAADALARALAKARQPR